MYPPHFDTLTLIDILKSPKVAGPKQWTLRFKQSKTTILVLCQPSQPFNSVKQDLLEAIQATGSKDFNGEGIPSDPEDVILGLPVDKNNLDKGWVNLEIQGMENEDKKGKGAQNGSVFNESPLGAGLKDGDMLAFKFRNRVDDNAMDEDFKWDVLIPSYEDE